MEKNIEKILEELYAIDPTLQKHENDLRVSVAELIMSKPDAKIDGAFIESLRARLVGMRYSRYAWFSSHTFRYALGGLAVALLLVLPFLFRDWDDGRMPANDIFTLAPRISSVDEEAFGRLTLSGTKGNRIADGESAAGMTTDGSYALQENAKISAPAGGGGSASIASPLIAPEFYQLAYSYAGDPIVLSDTTGMVFRRIAGAESTSHIVSFLEKLNFKIVNFSSFESLNVRSLELIEDRDDGYAISVNFDDGHVSISQNWSRATMSDIYRGDLSAKDIPPENELVDIANRFLREHNIDIGAFGDPSIDARWQPAILESQSAETQISMQDILSVRYPIVIDGKPVYDESGAVYGLDVGINIRAERVVSVHDLASQTYEGSLYPLETDFGIVRKIAERGGVYGFAGIPESESVKKIELATPEHVLMRYWRFVDEHDEELLVPALKFSVKKISDDSYYYGPRSIVIPLIKDLLKIPEAVPGPVLPLKGMEPSMDVSQ